MCTWELFDLSIIVLAVLLKSGCDSRRSREVILVRTEIEVLVEVHLFLLAGNEFAIIR